MINNLEYIKSVKEKKENGVFVCYFLTEKKGTVWSVVLDEENTHYQDILEWEKIDGNTIEEAD